jgi:hypothetical protein
MSNSVSTKTSSQTDVNSAWPFLKFVKNLTKLPILPLRTRVRTRTHSQAYILRCLSCFRTVHVSLLVANSVLDANLFFLSTTVSLCRHCTVFFLHLALYVGFTARSALNWFSTHVRCPPLISSEWS